MNYFAVMFLALNRDEEEAAYMMFLGLIMSKQLIGMYSDKLREFHVKNNVLKEILKKMLPQSLSNHISKKLVMSLDSITTPWIMTMFVGYINDPLYLLPILDNFII